MSFNFKVGDIVTPVGWGWCARCLGEKIKVTEIGAYGYGKVISNSKHPDLVGEDRTFGCSSKVKVINQTINPNFKKYVEMEGEINDRKAIL